VASLTKNPDYALKHTDPGTGFGLLYSEKLNDCVFVNPLAAALWRAPVDEIDPERDGAVFERVFGLAGGADYLRQVVRDMSARGVLADRDGPDGDHLSAAGSSAPPAPVGGPFEDGLTPPLEQIYFYATRDCNARCYHCYQPTFTVKDRSGDLSQSQIDAGTFLDLLRAALPLGLRAVKITGGEPLLRPDLRVIIEGVRRLGLAVSMETNAFLLDEDLADFLTAKEVDVSISLDGGSAEVHDSLRGLPGSFDRATRALELLAARGRDPKAIMAISRRNLADVEKVLAVVKSRGCDRVKFNPVNSLGVAGRLRKTNVLLEVGEIMDLYARRAELEADHGVFLFLEGPPSFATVFETVTGHSAVCPFAKILGILADGSISYCGVGNSCPELIFGKVTAEGFDIGDFWRTAEALVHSREVCGGLLEGVCGQCVLVSYCRGSCRALAYGELGSFAAPHPFCQTAYERGLFPSHYLRGR